MNHFQITKKEREKVEKSIERSKEESFTTIKDKRTKKNGISNPNFGSFCIARLSGKRSRCYPQVYIQRKSTFMLWSYLYNDFTADYFTHFDFKFKNMWVLDWVSLIKVLKRNLPKLSGGNEASDATLLHETDCYR